MSQLDTMSRATHAFWTTGRIAAALGGGAFIAVVLTLGDPGITVDEPLDVRPGRNYVATLLKQGSHFFDRKVVDAVYSDNAEHPPLGRWLLGIASTLGEPFEVVLRGADPLDVYVRSGRLAPAACFGALVGIVALVAGRAYGRGAGAAAGFALAVMPRCFAHAHLGALDTFVALFWTIALLATDGAIRSRRPVGAMAAAGAVWGLILLTKIHGWLLPPIVVAWAFTRLPWRRATLGVSLWTGVGLLVFFLGWPWLWYDFPGRLMRYLGTGVARTSILVQYFGTTYADREVPWHYPWVYFAVTVPIGLHVFGCLGVIQGWRRRGDVPLATVLMAAIGLLLALFSTRVPVYDGERLFLPVFPLWAIFIGLGFQTVWELVDGRKALRVGLLGLLGGQALGMVWMHPFGLSYYNLLVGGLPGAERLGLELTYWGDAVDGALLEELVRADSTADAAALAPTLAPGQGLYATTPAMARQRVLLQDQEAVPKATWVAVYRRTAYWTPEVRAVVERLPVMRRSRQGVWLAGLWRR
jgi:4-amino-4-deoxy-L-arabinose transferase-like glycosyltransferase